MIIVSSLACFNSTLLPSNNFSDAEKIHNFPRKFDPNTNTNTNTTFSSMISKTQVLNFPISFIILVILLTFKTEAKCSKSCGPNQVVHDFPYPFGFSADCPIRLSCSHDGAAMIGEFPVESINSDHIKLTVKAKCNRRLQTIHQFLSPYYAPTAHNAILLQNCSSPVAACFLPTTEVQTKFESPNCSVNRSSISCYTQNNTDFLDFKNLTGTHCDYLLSSILAAGISLEIQTAELGWWLPGTCSRSCHEHANCTELWSPFDGKPSHRCRCPDGLVGDGYLAGTGCRKASNCYTTKYVIGKCGTSAATRTAILIGALIAGAAVLFTLSLLCCFIRRRSTLRSTHLHKITKRRLSEAIAGAGKSPIRLYTYKEIQKATHNFSDDHLLGTGAYAAVYAAKLRTDEWVAIKRLKNCDPDTIQQVLNEINLISAVSHPNLVRLLGCSMESGDQILVYEFMPNGTLLQHLQKQRGSVSGLPWRIRLDIAVETATAIAHLHSAIQPPIFHRDIKSSNILLDQNLKSKVGDFGLSRLGMIEMSHISTAPQGTPGYLDPQYHQDFHLSDKSDVYSFGVVLVELITGMKVVDFCRPKNEVNLAALAFDRIGSGRLMEIVDPLMDGKDEWGISAVGEVAFRCLAFDRDVRPSMVEVAAELEEIRRRRWEDGELKGKEMELAVESGSSKSSHGGGDYFSRASVEDSWRSEQSSPSSSTLLSNVIL